MFSFIVILVVLVSMVISPTVNPGYASKVSSNDWTYTGDLSDAHWKGTATLLQNGQVLVTGGIGISGVTASAELYDPATGTWSSPGAMNTARQHHTATLLPDGRVLVAGGNPPDQQAFSSAELYDPVTGTWSYTGSMNQARVFHSAVLLTNGRVLVAGGSDGSANYNTQNELYDPVTGMWSYTGSLNMSRDVHSATLLTNGKVLVAGGYHGYGIESAELYDPVKGTWIVTGSMNEPRAWHTATLLPDGKVLVAGSEIFSNFLSSAEIYDPATGTWSTTGSMHDARGSHTATLLPDGKVLVAGGEGTNNRSAELYDPAIGTWSYTGSMGDGRSYFTGTFLQSGEVLASGGAGITTTELYTLPLSVFLIPSEQTLPGERGDTLQFVETLSNFTGITDTFNLELGDSPWPAALSNSILGPLGNGEEITFTVDVTIPLDADWNALNTVLITATSGISPTVYFDTAVLNSKMGLPPDLFLPMVIKAPEVIPGLTGKVTMNGVPIAGIPLDLRFYNGSSYSTYASTTTDADGNYLFSQVPALQPGQNYYVRYRNDADIDTRLAYWHTADNVTYNATSLDLFATFDIADIVLSTPEPEASVDLPVTFTWIPRPASPTDSYEFDLFDPANEDTYFYTDPPLGYVSSYTLQGLPGGFEEGEEYGWAVAVLSPEGGFGASYYYHPVTFKK